MIGLPGLTPRLLDRHGVQLVAAIRRGLAVPDNYLPHFPRGKAAPNPGIKARITHLKQWREGVCARLELATGLVAPNWLLERIAEQRPVTIEQLALVPGIRRWQLGLWGDELVRMQAETA